MSNVAPMSAPKLSLVQKFAARYSVEADKLLETLKHTAFRQKEGAPEVTNSQMVALLVVADQYGLNPFTKEIYAFPDKGGIVPVVSVDGWSRIVNDHAQCDGFEFIVSPETVQHAGKEVCVWMDVIMYRKDRAHTTRIREYFSEVVRNTQPWTSHPNRMLRHKTFIQGSRVGYGFSGIYDEDEAERIIERDVTAEGSHETSRTTTRSGAANLKAAVGADKKALPETAGGTPAPTDQVRDREPGADEQEREPVATQEAKDPPRQRRQVDTSDWQA